MKDRIKLIDRLGGSLVHWALNYDHGLPSRVYYRDAKGRFCKKPEAKKEFCVWCKGEHTFTMWDYPRCDNCGGC